MHARQAGPEALQRGGQLRLGLFGGRVEALHEAPVGPGPPAGRVGVRGLPRPERGVAVLGRQRQQQPGALREEPLRNGAGPDPRQAEAGAGERQGGRSRRVEREAQVAELLQEGHRVLAHAELRGLDFERLAEPGLGQRGVEVEVGPARPLHVLHQLHRDAPDVVGRGLRVVGHRR